MTFQDWIILIGLALPIIGNLASFVLRKLNKPSAAELVDRIAPFAARLGMAKDAKDLIGLAHEAAHVITTSEPNSIKLTNEAESASVRMDIVPPATPSGAAPPSTVVLPPNDPFSSGPVLRVAFAIFGVLALAGCGALQNVEHVVQLSSEVIARAEPCLMLQYEQAQVKCLELESADAARACVDSVKVTWKPVIDALGELRDVRCGIEPEKCR